MGKRSKPIDTLLYRHMLCDSAMKDFGTWHYVGLSRTLSGNFLIKCSLKNHVSELLQPEIVQEYGVLGCNVRHLFFLLPPAIPLVLSGNASFHRLVFDIAKTGCSQSNPRNLCTSIVRLQQIYIRQYNIIPMDGGRVVPMGHIVNF